LEPLETRRKRNAFDDLTAQDLRKPRETPTSRLYFALNFQQPQLFLLRSAPKALAGSESRWVLGLERSTVLP